MNSITKKVKPNETMVMKAARAIQDLIRSDYSKGGKLPSEPSLSEMLGVNRGTVRQALNILEQAGVVTRKHGSGTYVNANVLGLKMRLDNPFDLLELIRSTGSEARDELVSASTITATEQLVTNLDLDDNDSIFRICKKYYMNEVPAIYLEDHLPVSRFQSTINGIDFRRSIFDVLEEHCMCRISYGILAIKPIVCGEQIGTLLGLEPGAPVIKLCSTYYDLDNVKSIYSIGYYNTDLIELNVLRRRSL